jgi:hypothetical protein
VHFPLGLDMAKTPNAEMTETKRLMGALVRMKPKPHEDIPKRNGESRALGAAKKRPKKKTPPKGQ